MYSDEITSAAGTVSQVREITARIMKICKTNQITTIIIGHVTLREIHDPSESF